MIRTLAQHIAAELDRLENCVKRNDRDNEQSAYGNLAKLKSFLPSGSGFDSGTEIDLDRSRPDKLVLTTSFHHMRDGFYTMWTDHTVTVRPSFVHKFDIRISGRNVDDIKEYIHQVFYDCLEMELESTFNRETREIDYVAG